MLSSRACCVGSSEIFDVYACWTREKGCDLRCEILARSLTGGLGEECSRLLPTLRRSAFRVASSAFVIVAILYYFSCRAKQRGSPFSPLHLDTLHPRIKKKAGQCSSINYKKGTRARSNKLVRHRCTCSTRPGRTESVSIFTLLLTHRGPLRLSKLKF